MTFVDHKSTKLSCKIDIYLHSNVDHYYGQCDCANAKNHPGGKYFITEKTALLLLRSFKAMHHQVFLEGNAASAIADVTEFCAFITLYGRDWSRCFCVINIPPEDPLLRLNDNRRQTPIVFISVEKTVENEMPCIYLTEMILCLFFCLLHLKLQPDDLCYLYTSMIVSV